MVEVLNIFTVDLTNADGFTNRATVDVSTGSYEMIESDGSVTHKRVEIILQEDGDDRDTTTIAISPVKAVALVRRLMQVLDGLHGSGVEIPQVHSRFTQIYLDHLYGGDLDAETYESLLTFEDSATEENGVSLAEILPPAIKSDSRNKCLSRIRA